MKKHAKRFLSAFLAVAMAAGVIFLLPVKAEAREVIVKSSKIIASWDAGDRGDNVKATLYEKADGNYHLQFEGKGDMFNYSSDEAPWKADEYRKKITSASVLEGITSVGSWTLNDVVVNGSYFIGLQGLTNLKKVELAEGIDRIGVCAFGSSPLTYIRIPSTVRIIDENAFVGMSLNRLTLPASLKTVDTGAFSGGNESFYVGEVFYPGTKAEYEAISIGRYNAITDKEIKFGQTDPSYSDYTLTKYVLDDSPESITAFADVQSGAYYENAVNWAKSEGITTARMQPTSVSVRT